MGRAGKETGVPRLLSRPGRAPGLGSRRRPPEGGTEGSAEAHLVDRSFHSDPLPWGRGPPRGLSGSRRAAVLSRWAGGRTSAHLSVTRLLSEPPPAPQGRGCGRTRRRTRAGPAELRPAHPYGAHEAVRRRAGGLWYAAWPCGLPRGHWELAPVSCRASARVATARGRECRGRCAWGPRPALAQPGGLSTEGSGAR